MNREILLIFKNRFCFLNTLLAIEVFALTNFFLLKHLKDLPPRIPLWFNQFFLSDRLDTPINLIFIPLFGGILIFLNIFFVEKLLVKKETLLAFSLSLFSLAIQSALSLALLRIILRTNPISIELPNYYVTILIAFGLAYLLGFLFSPLSIVFARKFNLMDDPVKRQTQHPAILHTVSTPRAGALPVFLGILITGSLFIPFSKPLIGIYLGALIATATGLLDDKYDLNPYLRLTLQILAALTVIFSGVGIIYLTNPFGGLLWLDQLRINFFSHQIYPLAFIFAITWIIWMMNIVNWSKGVDGQFPMIVGIAAVIICLLSLRLVPFDEKQITLVLLSAITAGAVLGTAPFNWHPAKMFYGFGSTMVGLILASTAILAGAKVATALLILVVPTFDAVATILRRLKQGKSPVWGDRSHLHHRLHSLGWTHPKIATFYALTTSFFGFLALYSSGKYKLLTILAGAGLVAFLLIVLQLKLKLAER